MAYSTGTASDAADLWTKLLTFLTTNSALVSAGQNWTQVWTATDQRVLRGPGLAGDDQVYVGLKRVDRPTPDEWELQITGMTGVLSGATDITQHVNALQQPVRMFLDSSPQTYWFAANGRRFVVVVKISTVFQALYGGLFLPYADPTQYGYPMFVGGSAGTRSGAEAITSWRSVAEGHRHFCHAYENPFNPNAESSAWMMNPQGEWQRVVSTGATAANAIGPRRFLPGLDSNQVAGSGNWGYLSISERIRAGSDGTMMLTPHTLVSNSPADQTWGVLDGTFHAPGFGNSAENIITIGGVSHLVVQDVFRTGTGEFWALALA